MKCQNRNIDPDFLFTVTYVVLLLLQVKVELYVTTILCLAKSFSCSKWSTTVNGLLHNFSLWSSEILRAISDYISNSMSNLLNALIHTHTYIQLFKVLESIFNFFWKTLNISRPDINVHICIHMNRVNSFTYDNFELVSLGYWSVSYMI